MHAWRIHVVIVFVFFLGGGGGGGGGTNLIYLYNGIAKSNLVCSLFAYFLARFDKRYTVEPLYCGHLGDLVKCPV